MSDFTIALVRYVYDQFGHTATPEYEPFTELAQQMEPDSVVQPGQTQWFTSAKRALVLQNGSKLDQQTFTELDSNIKSYLDEINSARETNINLRYYQYLAVFFTEFVLHKRDQGVLNDEFKSFVQNEFVESDSLLADDINKLAYWMATGSGKTHILHINCLQVMEYFNLNKIDNFILIAPNENIAEQHIGELRENGIPHGVLGEDDKQNVIKVTDIHKLERGETGPKTLNIEEFGHDNIIFVDEGHKGLGSVGHSNSGWIDKRNYLSKNGFAFEYSATFASSLDTHQGYQEYSRSIIFDYPYGRFHADQYGKDYNILNTSPESDEAEFVTNETREWLLANLLAFYEKTRMFDMGGVESEYNIKQPLSVFVGNSVNAINRGESDVESVITFLADVMENENGWVTNIIDDVVSRNGRYAPGEMFDDRFGYIRESGLEPSDMYADLIERLFNSTTSARFEAHRLKNVEDEELALSTSDTDTHFGVITVGDTKQLFDRIAESENNIKTEENEIQTRSVFDQIEEPNSEVKFLVGSKKFAEGWDSTRPSTMGLLNLGRSEGPLVVQMFGRGVRVNGPQNDGKRADTDTLPAESAALVKRLETLDVFGLRAEYIETFKEHLENERVDVAENREEINVPVEREDVESVEPTLKVPHFGEETMYDEIPTVSLGAVVGGSDWDVETPTAVIQTQGQKITQDTEQQYEGSLTQYDIVNDLHIYTEGKQYSLPLDKLDWDSVFEQVLRYKQENNYQEIMVQKEAIKRIISESHYELKADRNITRLDSFTDKDRIESLCAHIVGKYIQNLYAEMVESVTYDTVTLKPIDNSWVKEHTPDEYVVTVEDADTNMDFIDAIRDDPEKFKQVLFRHLNQLYSPVLINSRVLREQQNEYKDIIHSVTPEGVDNIGESKFLSSLEYHITEGYLKDYETVIMRNQSVDGIGIPETKGKTYPDFVIWVTVDGVQHIILADPHGVILGEQASTIRAYRNANGKSVSDSSVQLHACLFARTKNSETLDDAKRVISDSINIEPDDFTDNHIYLIDDTVSDRGKTDEYVEQMLRNYLEK